MMPDPIEVIVARIEQRLIAVEREINARRHGWPSIVSSLVALAALLIVLAEKF